MIYYVYFYVYVYMVRRDVFAVNESEDANDVYMGKGSLHVTPDLNLYLHLFTWAHNGSDPSLFLGRMMTDTWESRQWSRVEGIKVSGNILRFLFFNCQFYDAKTWQTSKFASCAISGWGFARLLVWYRIPRSRQRGQSEFRVTKQWIFNVFFWWTLHVIWMLFDLILKRDGGWKHCMVALLTW